jgi:hypothetical protein
MILIVVPFWHCGLIVDAVCEIAQISNPTPSSIDALAGARSVELLWKSAKKSRLSRHGSRKENSSAAVTGAISHSGPLAADLPSRGIGYGVFTME